MKNKMFGMLLLSSLFLVSPSHIGEPILHDQHVQDRKHWQDLPKVSAPRVWLQYKDYAGKEILIRGIVASINKPQIGLSGGSQGLRVRMEFENFPSGIMPGDVITARCTVKDAYSYDVFANNCTYIKTETYNDTQRNY